MTGARAAKRIDGLRKIEDAAAALFAQQGYENTTAEQIARHAGVAPRTFFRYCPTKVEALLQPMLEVEAAIDERLSADPAGRERLQSYEHAIADVLRTLDEDDDGLLERLLRIRSLIAADDGLRRAVFAWDGEHLLDLQRRWVSAATAGGSADRLAVSLSVLVLRRAFDQWGEAQGSSSTGLLHEYRIAVRNLRRIVAPE